MESSNIYRSTDRRRNPIWLPSHYITLFCHQLKFSKKRGKRGFLPTRRPKRGVSGKKRGKGIKKRGGVGCQGIIQNKR
jgi:hypothetical protein